MIAGNGVRQAGAAELLQEFAAKTDIPVLTTMNAVDLMQDDGKLGFIGVYGNRIANMVVSEADLVIAVGARLGLRQIGSIREYFAPKAHLIRADIDQYELSRLVKADEEKHLTDAKDFLAGLLAESIPKYTDWKEKCFQARDMLSVYDRTEGNRCIEKISSLLPPDPVIAVDVGQNQCWSAQSFTLKGTKGRLLIGGGYGSMGCALPYAIGASIATGGGTVYCVTGDGGLQMNIQELQTVEREQLPVKILVVNNHALGKISEIQAGSYDGRYAQTTGDSGYTVPDFAKIAEAYGIRAGSVATYEELDGYAGWLEDDCPALVDIAIAEDSRLIPKVNWNSKEIQPLLPKKLEETVRMVLDGGMPDEAERKENGNMDKKQIRGGTAAE